jgi:hypothetical protein
MKVIVGGVTLKDTVANAFQPLGATSPPSFEIISRNVLRVDIPKDAKPIRTAVVYQDPSVLPRNPDDPDCAPVTGAKEQPGASKTMPECQCKQRYVIDVHVATPNGISNHLLVEVPAPAADNKKTAEPISTTVMTTTKPNPADGSTQTLTEFKTTPPGIVLPPGTYLPMGANLPTGATLVAPGAATASAIPPGFLPGTVPNTQYQPPSTTETHTSGNAPVPRMPESNKDFKIEERPGVPGTTTTPTQPAIPHAPTQPAAPAPGGAGQPAAPAPNAPPNETRPTTPGGVQPNPGEAAMFRDRGVVPTSVAPSAEGRRTFGFLPRLRPSPPAGAGPGAEELDAGAPALPRRKTILSRVLGGAQ